MTHLEKVFAYLLKYHFTQQELLDVINLKKISGEHFTSGDPDLSGPGEAAASLVLKIVQQEESYLVWAARIQQGDVEASLREEAGRLREQIQERDQRLNSLRGIESNLAAIAESAEEMKERIESFNRKELSECQE